MIVTFMEGEVSRVSERDPIEERVGREARQGEVEDQAATLVAATEPEDRVLGEQRDEEAGYACCDRPRATEGDALWQELEEHKARDRHQHEAIEATLQAAVRAQDTQERGAREEGENTGGQECHLRSGSHEAQDALVKALRLVEWRAVATPFEHLETGVR